MDSKGFFPVPKPAVEPDQAAQPAASSTPASTALDSASVSIATPPTRLALSEMAPGVMQSEIRAMTTECDRIGGINLAQGVCDTPVPTVVEEAAIEAIRAGFNI